MIVNPSTEPLEAAVTFVFCWIGELDSNRKSPPEFGSPVLYGKVFLTRSELLKSNVWSKVSADTWDLYVSPIKYGNFGSNLPVVALVDTPTKYAYTPFGNSGVFVYLPLWISRSPLSSNT